ncbi:DUF1129 family protein [Jeotgalibacillus proteolyticus]|uniref:DUF1129 domain-containing protein n=1 Tax=Jeotgalibacillus proteolyticus TaxID=2082395 RepID=A0A2S5G688_9BACL|nr:DUF1129 family protein [Jeotgalibacillus proteolyticus]PPA68492.1 hypothetical protein C4B60_20840 [Jeotgalibacillus proteolyticus]
MATTTTYIQLNNDRRKKLTDENEEIYGDILLYVRSSNVDQRAGEELLMELLEHLIEAQDRRKRAVDVFGSDPKEYCKSLVDELPKESVPSKILFFIYMFSYGVMWMFGTMGVIEFLFPSLKQPIALSHLVLFGALFITIPAAAIVLMKQLAFSKERSKQAAWSGVALSIILLPYAIFLLAPSTGEVVIAPWVYVVIALLLFIGTRLLKQKVFD